MATRKTAREALAGLFSVSEGGFTVINPFLPLSLNGASKILNIFARASSLKVSSQALKKDFHIFYLDTLVLRLGTAVDEDTSDALHEIIVAAIKANPANSNWQHIELDGETEIRPVKDSGEQYIRERHRVKVKLPG